MKLNQLNVIIVTANLIIGSVTASFDSGVSEKLITPELKEVHTRMKRSWLSLDRSAVLERRRRLMKTTGEFMNDLNTLLSGRLPFTKVGTTQEQEANPAGPPGLSESQLKQMSTVYAAEKKGYFDNAVKKAIMKKLNAGSLAAGAVGLLWPGPLAPVVSALLAPIVSDYVANKHQNL